MERGNLIILSGIGVLGVALLMMKKGGQIEGAVRNLQILGYDDRVPSGSDFVATISLEHMGPNEPIPVIVRLNGYSHEYDINTGSHETWDEISTGIYMSTINIPLGIYDLKVQVANISDSLQHAVEIYTEGEGIIESVAITSVESYTELGTDFWKINWQIIFSGDTVNYLGTLFVNEQPVGSVSGTSLDAPSPYSSYILLPKSAAPTGPVIISLMLNGVYSPLFDTTF